MAVKYWPVAVVKDVKNYPFLTKGISANNIGSGDAKLPVATLRKPERLCQEQLIASLFAAGHRFLSKPYQIIFLLTPLPEQVPVQMMVSVSRRRFPRAVDRNRIKRHIREAYRKHKHELYTYLEQNQLQLALAIVYTGRSVTTFNETENKIPVALSLIIQRLAEHSNKS